VMVNGMNRRLNIVWNLLLIIVLTGSVNIATAGPDPEGKIYARTKYGIVRKLDMVNHVAIISGYRYEFGALQTGWMAEVKMVDSEFGSFEMLKPGMKVKVVYGELGFTRVVLRLKQLPDDTFIKEY